MALTSRYLNDLLNIENSYNKSIENQIYLPGLWLNKTNVSDTKALFLNIYDQFQRNLSQLKFMIRQMTVIATKYLFI